MSTSEPSCLYSGNAAFVEDLYESYLRDPDSVTSDWRRYFDTFGAPTAAPERAHGPVRAAFAAAARSRRTGAPAAASVGMLHQKQVAVLQLINAHRFLGHRQADLDPLQQYDRPQVVELDPAYHGLTDADLDASFNTGSLFGPANAPLREILHIVRQTYCGTVGAEYMHINDTAQKRWIQERLELALGRPHYDPARRRDILERVIAANALEEYLHTKYVGQKRFSLEGGESFIALLDAIIQGAGAAHTKEVVLGMAHRGRLNVLVNIIGKNPADLFDEFEGKHKPDVGSGDVKYHLGYSSDVQTPGGPVHLTLSFNPSHLEIIDPVVEGSVRARQDRRGDAARNEVLPILIHGDAAFAGQGVVMETFNLSQTRGYSTGGTVHVIINNQIGFTTSDPLDSRSTLYCTDVAKVVQAPIFHVNGDDPEAVVFIAELALAYRMEFHKDIVVDLVCFRRHGHSEADEPAATQPLMYRKIRQHPGVRKIYADRLLAEGVLDDAAIDAMSRGYVEALEHNRIVSRPHAQGADSGFLINYEIYKGKAWDQDTDTSITLDRLQALSTGITTVPEGFKLHRAVSRLLDARRDMARGETPLDWGYAETLAYASLLEEGYPVRLSGQDSARGTFFHRHAVILNQDDGSTYLPLQHLTPGQAKFLVINSTLSEAAVLAFEYGYASSAPKVLVIWEAQFGDFANNAQVVIDQFIASCEAKWGRLCGLVMMLPHGYDGQGPEHSSARLERFLQLCAETNMQVCVPSTPAQMFHMLRRQVLRPFRRPLIIMSPKSLLRHKWSTSTVADLTGGRFHNVIDETDPIDPARVTRILACSGKIYFDLIEARRQHGIEHIAIARLEQLYPFPKDELQAVVDRYPNAKEMVWVQEEPRNQGAWMFMLSRHHLSGCLHKDQTLHAVARPYSASPAVGYMHVHLQQQQALLDDALQLGAIDIDQRKKSA
ncbi:MAG: 2-oxoglutarate dehydrogenase E1 component [Gammaproteobacteria bacterium]|nr:2-oxoglutarate dehydrogenase E1 component [Gammaproteobacteria bacterium]